jgi:hypothetical protein
MLGPSKDSIGYSQSAIGWITGPPMEELERSATLYVEQHYELTSTPELLTLAAYVSKDGLVCHHWKERPIVLQTLYAPVQGNPRAKKWEWVGRRVGGRVWTTFGIALEM